MTVKVAVSRDGGVRRFSPSTSPSGQEGGGRVTGAELLSAGGSKGRLRGTVLHAWFEQVGFVDEPGGIPEADILRAVARREAHSVARDVIDGWVEAFYQVLERPAIRGALVRSGAEELWRERPFALVQLRTHKVERDAENVVVEEADEVPGAAWVLRPRRASAAAREGPCAHRWVVVVVWNGRLDAARRVCDKVGTSTLLPGVELPGRLRRGGDVEATVEEDEKEEEEGEALEKEDGAVVRVPGCDVMLEECLDLWSRPEELGEADKWCVHACVCVCGSAHR